MRTLLIANLLFEGVMGILMIFAPGVLMPDHSLTELEIALFRGFGIAALTMAMISILVMGSIGKDRAFFFGIILLILYHMGQTIVQTINAFQETIPIPVAAVHAFFNVAFVFMFVRRRSDNKQEHAKP